MYSLTDIILVLLFALVLVYWWRSGGLHTRALTFARKYCRERGIQLLDETLVFSRFAFSKAENNRRYFSRIYSFDFCRDGMDRHKGEIILRGNSVMRVMLEGDTLEITEY